MAGDFDGLVAIVTGGGSGIGLANRAAEPPLPLVADVTDEGSVRAAVAAAVERFGGVDVLVNNAGIGATGTVEDNPYEEWRRVLDVNLLGVVRSTRAALPHLRRSASAAIVNTCSIA